MAAINKRNQDKARSRLARIRVADKKALPGVQPSKHGNLSRAERYKILEATRKLNAQKKATHDRPPKPKPFNPLAPMAGDSLDNEVRARANLQFGPQEQEIKGAIGQNESERSQAAGAFDAYRQELIAATARINAKNAEAAAQSQTAVDTSANQASAEVTAREADLKARQEKLGLQADPNAAQSGALAVAGARSQGTQGVNDIRKQGTSTNALMEEQQANSLLSKQESMSRRDAAKAKLQEAERQLKGQRGSFEVSERGKLTESERTYALARKEFGLKEKDVNAGIAIDKAKVSAEKKASNAQVLVAKIYAQADKAKARATIRVAKLQLEKGKIDKHQYREIVNIYKGLPEKGKPGAPAASKPGKPGKPASGSGKDGTLAPWERDKVGKAVSGYTTNKYGPADRDRAIQKAIQAGIPERLARAAWRRYIKRYQKPPTVTPGASPNDREGRN